MRSSIALASLNLALAIAHNKHHPKHNSSETWSLDNFKTIVTFGDSYTDENRLNYFGSHNYTAPPVGWDQPVGYAASTGGLVWPRYASIYTDTTLYNYAVSGAVCSNKITPRPYGPILFPDIQSYELPAFVADSNYVTPNGTRFFSGTSDDTVYAIWIGTNDVGNGAFLTDSQVKGKTLKDYMDCVYDVVDGLYANGARYFVLMNLAPLELAPQYAVPENGGASATKFYPNKGNNITGISWRMYETVVTLNEVYKYRTPFEKLIAEAWPGAKMANYDVNALMTDIWQYPAEYLNGTAPLNVTGVVNQCNVNGTDCVKAPNPDSYMWYDELHPSEQTDRVIAREFAGVMSGDSKWATYWG